MSAQDFAKDVAPLLQAKCQGCHGPQVQMSGLRLDSGDGVRLGGLAGAVIIPGQSAQSRLIQRVTSAKKGFAMPPTGAPLTPAEIAVLSKWIDAGAVVPAPLAANDSTPPKSQHWAFQPVRQPTLPDVRQRMWARGPIDQFVLAKLEAQSLTPSPEASKTTLLRRISLDLTGLPPTPEEVSSFLADNRPDAYERAVDQLLASPHYGEKWARFWLDLAHYADSDGYEKDLVRPGAWRYRQWVIDALNRDLPFDQFTIEQLAGDLLPQPTVEQRVATGFLRNSLTNREGGVDRKEARFEQLVNRTNTVSTVWLGLTMGCAQCHNHKFDPTTQKDYYRLMAFLHTAEEADIPAPLPGEMGPYLQNRPVYLKARAELLKQYDIPTQQAIWEDKIREAMARPGQNLEWDFAVTEFRAMFDRADHAIKIPAAERSQSLADQLTEKFLSTIGPDFARDQEGSKKLKEARSKLSELKAASLFLTEAPVMEDDPAAGPAYIHIGGDWKNLGLAVSPGTPGFLTTGPSPDKPNRLTLARWLVASENPLTARVMVNRVWQELFGSGLVRTSEDFGTQGEKPTHPELLDYLALQFRDQGWSLKRLQRQIVLSATYRQSSKVQPVVQQRGPDNSLLSRQTRLRLPAELVRDEALAASGLLELSIGGKSIRPPQPAGVAELVYGNGVKRIETTGPERYRRGLYIHFQRTAPYPQLMNFDAPDSNVACSRRQRSNSPLQALNLLNDPVFFEAAQALAARVWQEAEAPSRLDRAFTLCLNREPTSAERERLRKFHDQEATHFRQQPQAIAALLPVVPEGADPAQAAALVSVSRVLLNLDEFITRE